MGTSHTDIIIYPFIFFQKYSSVIGNNYENDNMPFFKGCNFCLFPVYNYGIDYVV